jgi:hypothetical protein
MAGTASFAPKFVATWYGGMLTAGAAGGLADLSVQMTALAFGLQQTYRPLQTLAVAGASTLLSGAFLGGAALWTRFRTTPTPQLAPVPRAGNAASTLPSLEGLDRAAAHIAIRDHGFRLHGTTDGWYVRYRHPDGSDIWIRPNGQVVRLGPKPPGVRNRPRYDSSGNPADHPQGEFLEPLPGHRD